MNKNYCKQCYYSKCFDTDGERVFDLEDDDEWLLKFEDNWNRGLIHCCKVGGEWLLSSRPNARCPYLLEHLLFNDEPTDEQIDEYLENPTYMKKLQEKYTKER